MKPEVIEESPGASDHHQRAVPRLGFELPESKFHPPAARPGIVARTALVDRLAAAQAPVITVVAPPGYGKTMLMAQWAERIGPRVAWVSCDDGDNDPTRFLNYLVTSLQTIAGNIGKGVLAFLQSPQPLPAESILTTLLNEMAGKG